MRRPLILIAALLAASAHGEAPLAQPWHANQQIAFFEAGKGNFEASAQKMKDGLELAERALGEGSPDLIPVLLDSVATLRRLARYVEARAQGRWALALAEKYLEPKDPLRLRACMEMAAMSREQGSFEQAALYYDEAELSAPGPLLELERARLYQLWGKKLDAVARFKLALDEKKGLQGEMKETAQLEYADLLLEWGKLDEASKLYAKALATRKARLPEGHVDMSPCLEGLGKVELARGKKDKAMELFAQSEKMRKGTLGPDIWPSLKYLDGAAELYRLMGRHAEAIALFQRCVGINEKSLGEKHPLVARALRRLGVAQKDAGKAAEARKSWARAKEILISNFSGSDSRVHQIENLIASLQP